MNNTIKLINDGKDFKVVYPDLNYFWDDSVQTTTADSADYFSIRHTNKTHGREYSFTDENNDDN